MSALTTAVTAPSGAFMPHADVNVFSVPPVAVYNPGVLSAYQGSFEATAANNWISQCREFEKCSFDKYSAVITELAATLQANTADCRLAPLRGSARPCLLLEVMSNGKLAFEFFDFQQGSLGKRDGRIIEALMDILKRCDPLKQTYRIQIVDTAKGGYGIAHLSSLLRKIHQGRPEFRDQHWQIEAYLIHPPTKPQNVDRMMSAEVTDKGFYVKVIRHQVDDLIVEDYEAAMGFKLDYDGATWIAKPSINPGRFILKDGKDVRLIESENLYVTFTELFSRSITEGLLADPNRDLVNVIWNDYTEKL